MRPLVLRAATRSLLVRSLVISAPLLGATLGPLGCSTTPPLGEPGAGWGGASFVAWPPPVVEQGSDADNPWLSGQPPASGTGSASGSGTGGGTGGSTDGQAPNAGGQAPDGAPGPSSGGAGGGAGGSGGSLEPARLILRAYVESSGSFKGVLVENLGGAPAGDCSVELHSNGGTEVWRRLAVPTGLAGGQRALLCVPDGAVAACTVGFGGSVFNGNDALVLRCEGQLHDTLGHVGLDPGKGWSGTGYDGQPASTVDGGLWRCDQEQRPSGFAFEQWVSWDWSADPAWSGPTCAQAGWGGAGGVR